MEYLLCFSLCELLSVVSCLSTTTGKYEEFISEVIVTLWGWTQHSNTEVACAALRFVYFLTPSDLKIIFFVHCKNIKKPNPFYSQSTF